MANVTFKNLNKIYDWMSGESIHAVRDFNLDIKDGEIIVFVGPSGCGKSTTLRMIAGLEEITRGELYIDGTLVNDIHSKNRGIAMVFQNYALFPHMTVYENVAFGLKPHEMSDDEVKEKVAEVACALDLTHLLERVPRQLSGGQKQRVALGRALIRKQKIVLLDEPLSHLDAKLRLAMRTELIRLHRKFNTTFIYVTHDQNEAMAIADRIVVMRDGMIQQVGTPEELYTRPDNLFVAGFLGTPRINMCKVKITEHNDEIFINWNDNKIKLKLPKSKTENTKVKEYVGKEVYIGIRPEDIYTDEANINKFKDSLIDAVVEIREFCGDRVYLYFDDYFDNICVSPDCKAQSGDKIKIAINLDKIHLFDVDTEMTIVN